MPPFDPLEATVSRVREAILGGDATARSVTQAFLSRIEALNPRINAIITLNPMALHDADVVDAAVQRGQVDGALLGVPVLLKDNFDTASMPTTAGCLALRDSRPSRDAPSVTALKHAGAIVLGKTNLHELALEGLSVSSAGGQTRNPYDSTRTPGGSSGGSSAAVAASLCVLATGSDTVNSLRSPASACSLCSARPTRGLLGRAGVVPVSRTQDALGPIARCVADVAVTLGVMAGSGLEADAGALGQQESRVDFVANLAGGSVVGARFGLVEGFFNRAAGVETTPVNEAMEAMVRRLEGAGATVVRVTSDMFDSRAILGRLDTQRYEYNECLTEYLRRPDLGGVHPKSMPEVYRDSRDFMVIPAQYEYVNTALEQSTETASYASVQRGIQELKTNVLKVFDEHQLHALVYPQQENLVVTVGSPSQAGRNGIMAAVTGLPVVTLPAGFSPATETAPRGVPIGMEMLGRPWEDARLLQMAYQVEQLQAIRKSPLFAETDIPTQGYNTVPVVQPDRSSIDAAYPLGQI